MTEYNKCADEELLERFHQGEHEIMDYILDKYKNLVRKRAKEMYLIGGEGDDLIQEGMIGLFKAVRDYRSNRETSFFTFADLCISRQIYTAIKASNRMKHRPLNTYISLYADVRGADGPAEDRSLIEQLHSLSVENPEAILIDQENVIRVQKYMAEKLSKLELEVLLLYLSGNEYQEIAKLMGRPQKTVDNALQRARMKLSACIQK